MSNENAWKKDEIPYPNSNAMSYTKKFGRIHVTIWFTNEMEYANFTVRAGANSELSYTGSFYPEKELSVKQMQSFIDEMHKNKTLIK